MAGKGGKSDLIQITMLTMYLMAVFFGGVGVFFKYVRFDSALAERKIQDDRLKQLSLLLKDPKSVEAATDRLRREEAERLQGNLDQAIGSVVGQVAGDLVLKSQKEGKRTKLADGLEQREFTITFAPCDFDRGLIQFIWLIEHQQSNIDFSKVKLDKNRRGKGDGFDSTFTLVSVRKAE